MRCTLKKKNLKPQSLGFWIKLISIIPINIFTCCSILCKSGCIYILKRAKKLDKTSGLINFNKGPDNVKS